MNEYKEIIVRDKRLMVMSDGSIFMDGKQLAPADNGLGYMRVRIAGKYHCVHVLVADAFIGPRPDGMEIDHKNGNKCNNGASNLEYVSKSENTKRFWASRKVNRSGNRGKAKLKAYQVRDIRELYKSGKSKNSIAKKYNVTHGCVRHILSGRTHGNT